MTIETHIFKIISYGIIQNLYDNIAAYVNRVKMTLKTECVLLNFYIFNLSQQTIGGYVLF